LKLVAHRCHVNHANLFNQVGIIAMNVSMLRSDDPLFVTRDRFLGSMHSNTLIMTFFREIVLQTRVIMLMTSRLASMSEFCVGPIKCTSPLPKLRQK